MIHLNYNGNTGHIFEYNFKNDNIIESYLNKNGSVFVFKLEI